MNSITTKTGLYQSLCVVGEFYFFLSIVLLAETPECYRSDYPGVAVKVHGRIGYPGVAAKIYGRIVYPGVAAKVYGPRNGVMLVYPRGDIVGTA